VEHVAEQLDPVPEAAREPPRDAGLGRLVQLALVDGPQLTAPGVRLVHHSDEHGDVRHAPATSPLLDGWPEPSGSGAARL
jgi:hypothetical protein